MDVLGLGAFQAREKPCLLSGKERKRISVAAKMALATAGQRVNGPTSPVPPSGRAPLLIKGNPTRGVSGIRRIQYSCQLLCTALPRSEEMSDLQAHARP